MSLKQPLPFRIKNALSGEDIDISGAILAWEETVKACPRMEKIPEVETLWDLARFLISPAISRPALCINFMKECIDSGNPDEAAPENAADVDMVAQDSAASEQNMGQSEAKPTTGDVPDMDIGIEDGNAFSSENFARQSTAPNNLGDTNHVTGCVGAKVDSGVCESGQQVSESSEPVASGLFHVNTSLDDEELQTLSELRIFVDMSLLKLGAMYSDFDRLFEIIPEETEASPEIKDRAEALENGAHFSWWHETFLGFGSLYSLFGLDTEVVAAATSISQTHANGSLEYSGLGLDGGNYLLGGMYRGVFESVVEAMLSGDADTFVEEHACIHIDDAPLLWLHLMTMFSEVAICNPMVDAKPASSWVFSVIKRLTRWERHVEIEELEFERFDFEVDLLALLWLLRLIRICTQTPSCCCEFFDTSDISDWVSDYLTQMVKRAETIGSTDALRKLFASSFANQEFDLSFRDQPLLYVDDTGEWVDTGCKLTVFLASVRRSYQRDLARFLLSLDFGEDQWPLEALGMGTDPVTGKTVLHAVAGLKGMMMADILSKLCAIQEIQVDATDNNGDTALRNACCYGRYENAIALLNHPRLLEPNQALLELVCRSRVSLRTADDSESEKHRCEVLEKVLCHAQVDPNVQDSAGRTALHVLAFKLRTELDTHTAKMLDLLLSCEKVDINIKDKMGESAADLAKQQGTSAGNAIANAIARAATMRKLNAKDSHASSNTTRTSAWAGPVRPFTASGSLAAASLDSLIDKSRAEKDEAMSAGGNDSSDDESRDQRHGESDGFGKSKKAQSYYSKPQSSATWSGNKSWWNVQQLYIFLIVLPAAIRDTNVTVISSRSIHNVS